MKVWDDRGNFPAPNSPPPSPSNTEDAKGAAASDQFFFLKHNH